MAPLQTDAGASNLLKFEKLIFAAISHISTKCIFIEKYKITYTAAS